MEISEDRRPVSSRRTPRDEGARVPTLGVPDRDREYGNADRLISLSMEDPSDPGLCLESRRRGSPRPHRRHADALGRGTAAREKERAVFNATSKRTRRDSSSSRGRLPSLAFFPSPTRRRVLFIAFLLVFCLACWRGPVDSEASKHSLSLAFSNQSRLPSAMLPALAVHALLSLHSKVCLFFPLLFSWPWPAKALPLTHRPVLWGGERSNVLSHPVSFGSPSLTDSPPPALPVSLPSGVRSPSSSGEGRCSRLSKGRTGHLEDAAPLSGRNGAKQHLRSPAGFILSSGFMPSKRMPDSRGHSEAEKTRSGAPLSLSSSPRSAASAAVSSSSLSSSEPGPPSSYCVSTASTQRLSTRTVVVGRGALAAPYHDFFASSSSSSSLTPPGSWREGYPVLIGGSHPLVVQTMTNSDTRDVQATIRKCAEAGASMVRMTVQGMKEVEASKFIKEKLDKANLRIPLVADVHFQPRVGLAAAEIFDKVRINPGNFADGAKKWEDEVESATGSNLPDERRREAEAERRFDDGHKRIEELLVPLIEKCKTFNTAMRIGTNHGSLSARILRRYGDTPRGMVASAFEFADICVRESFRNFCFSMKSSNPRVMVHAYRLLASEMLRRNELFPIHLGVTEAGEGEDGRLKSAVGIGALLQDGIGDTLRVSLTEPPWREIPVALSIARMQEQKLRFAAQTGERWRLAGRGRASGRGRELRGEHENATAGRDGEGCDASVPSRGEEGSLLGEHRQAEDLGFASGIRASSELERQSAVLETSAWVPRPFEERTRNFENIEKRTIRPLFSRSRATQADTDGKGEGEPESQRTGDERILHRDGTVMVRVSPAMLEVPEVFYKALGCKVVGGKPFRSIASVDSIYLPSLSLPSQQEGRGLVARAAQARETLHALQEAGVGVLVPFPDLAYLVSLQKQQEEETRKAVNGNRDSVEPERGATRDGARDEAQADEAERERFLLQTSLLPSKKEGLVGVLRLRDAAAVRGKLLPFVRDRLEGVALLVDGHETEEEIDAVLEMESLLFFLLRPPERGSQGVTVTRRFVDILKRREEAEAKKREAKGNAEGGHRAESREGPGGIPVIHWLERTPSVVAESELASKDGETGKNNRLMLEQEEEQEGAIYAGWEVGSLLVDALGEGVLVDLPGLSLPRQIRLGFNLLQACRLRSTKTEFISCPSCGRTLFDIQKVSAEIRRRTGHLPGVTIAVMGCIVNGVGEMADADFGYVGGAPGKVDLYVKKKVVKRGIPSAEACDALVALIKQHGRWVDPPKESAESAT
uniref:4-hydroxy-3-methylbut-2-en-1-yl diphosphate synthase, related n=1 Tax=Neospora caninum (strain Liverpool) TaxID=572307 RepID=A0A0F7UA36_NEOCL|nr:TPA: 4-hydroxy-3-methylbut-2-en-1-yl diphosphate synthase, related [Neospora caninum Liverpool]